MHRPLISPCWPQCQWAPDQRRNCRLPRRLQRPRRHLSAPLKSRRTGRPSTVTLLARSPCCTSLDPLTEVSAMFVALSCGARPRRFCFRRRVPRQSPYRASQTSPSLLRHHMGAHTRILSLQDLLSRVRSAERPLPDRQLNNLRARARIVRPWSLPWKMICSGPSDVNRDL